MVRNHITLTGALLCGLIGLISCRQANTPTMRTGKLPLGTVGPPAAFAVLKGQALVGGWAIHESGIGSVELYVDRDFVLDAGIGVDRPDVAKVFPAFRKEAISGWNALLDTTRLSEGDHELVARVRTKDGSHRDFAVPFKVAR